MNAVYKILTKILATRSIGVLHTIIHPDQKGFVPDRYTGENINDIISVIDKLDIEDNPGLLVSIDIYRAFDTLQWSFIMKAFENFIFPEYLIKWVSVISNNIDSHIISNGHMSEGFMIKEG